MSDYLDPNNEELLKDFFAEADLQVEILEQSVLAIEDNPSDHEAIDEIFRAAHTLKGGAATVQMGELAEFTHLVEDLLDVVRSEKVKINEHVVDVLLASIDIIKEMLSQRMTGSIYQEDISGIKANLKQLVLSEEAPSQSQVPLSNKIETSPVAKPNEASSLTEYEILELNEAASGKKVSQVTVLFDEENPMNSVGGIQVFAKLKGLGEILKTVPDFDKLYEDVFYPKVQYFLASDKSLVELEEAAFIREVTLQAEALPLGESSRIDSFKEVASPEPPSPQVPEPQPVKEDPIVKSPIGEVEAPVDKKTSVDKKPPVVKKVQGVKQKSKENSGSILRVDSKRVDNLLNLVSEAVINKATFNQISTSFATIQNDLASAELKYKEKLQNLFDEIPTFIDQSGSKGSGKDFKRDVLEKYGDIFSIFDSFEQDFKKTIGTFKSTAANLGRNTGDLHEAILKIRMVPINQIFSRFPRLVRDLSKSLDKKIKLTIEGEDTELDKSVIEELLDPLMHCVRNSLDHGIESPEARIAAGKDPEGQILLKASNEGNMIVIEIADDGAGIDVEVVKQKAIERGVIHPNKILSDVEAYNLIFEPGFSTAKEVTNISGRGVGLDVVRKEIAKLNGSVKVDSSPGEGSRFTIKLPLTLAIIQGLLVQVGTEVYAIPITSVIESHRIKPEDIKIIDNHEVFNVREDVVSLVRMNRLFRIDTKEDQDYHFIVIVGSGDKKLGVMVDSLIGEEDVVIKPLKDSYTNSPGIAGATILGDGTVSLIVDVSQLLDLCIEEEQASRIKRKLQ